LTHTVESVRTEVIMYTHAVNVIVGIGCLITETKLSVLTERWKQV